jgi:hypothetical protein
MARSGTSGVKKKAGVFTASADEVDALLNIGPTEKDLELNLPEPEAWKAGKKRLNIP